jgi:hypothetical protein
VRQQVIATLGRFQELQASGQRLLRSGARLAAKAMVLSAASDDAALKIAVRRLGPALTQGRHSGLGSQATGHQHERPFREARKIATMCLKFGVHPGNPGSKGCPYAPSLRHSRNS